VTHAAAALRSPLQLALAVVLAATLVDACSVRRETRSASTGSTTSAITSATQAPAAQPAPLPPTGTRVDFDTLMRDVRTLDSTIRVDLRYRGTNNFTGAPLAGYNGNTAYLRLEAAAALARVQRALRADGFGLLVYDAYRPVRATLAMVQWTERTNQQALIRDGYISDRSRHNLGVAIDCTLVTLATGAPLDMGVPFDTFSKAAHTVNASGVVAQNRQRFVQAMQREGFTNYDQEWWHFSFDVPAASLRRFDIEIR
jgi:D-alanyl-D-alanine dipeptidase